MSFFQNTRPPLKFDDFIGFGYIIWIYLHFPDYALHPIFIWYLPKYWTFTGPAFNCGSNNIQFDLCGNTKTYKELNIWIQRHAVIRYILYKNKEETHKILKEPHAAEIITFVILQFNIYRGSLITGKFTSFAGQCYHNSMPRVFVKIIS